MEKKQYTERVEGLGYKAVDGLVTAVEKAHDAQLTDALVDQAYADFRRGINKPVAVDAEPASARRGRPANKPAKPAGGATTGGGAPTT